MRSPIRSSLALLVVVAAGCTELPPVIFEITTPAVGVQVAIAACANSDSPEQCICRQCFANDAQTEQKSQAAIFKIPSGVSTVPVMILQEAPKDTMLVPYQCSRLSISLRSRPERVKVSAGAQLTIECPDGDCSAVQDCTNVNTSTCGGNVGGSCN